MPVPESLHISLIHKASVNLINADAATEGVLLKKGVLKTLASFTEKQLCWSIELQLLEFDSFIYFITRQTSTMEHFAKIANGFGKHCARVSSLITLQAALKKETPVQVFSCEFCEIFKNTFLRNTSLRLLLDRIQI